MVNKPTYEELEARIKELETKLTGYEMSHGILREQRPEPEQVLEPGSYPEDTVRVSGVDIKWNTREGMCTFENLPIAMMWVDTTLANLMSGVQAMVGTERFGLSLQSAGRKSVETDWKIISQFADFPKGFKAIANIAAVAGWGEWELMVLDEKQKRCHIKVRNSWEGVYQKALGVCWGSGMLAGKMAGYCSKHFGTNCWAEQTKFIAKGAEFDEFIIKPSERTIEDEIENLLATDEATRADMAVALEKLKREISGREQTEKILRESEEKYRRLVDLSFEGVAIHRGGRIVYINNAGAQLLGGCSPGDIVGRPVMDFVHPDDRDHVEKRIHTMKTKSIGVTISEERFTGIDGRELTVEVAAVPVDYQGERAVQVVFRDITELKLKEKALRESERRYRHVIENAPTVAWITSQNGRTVFISSNVEKIYGYTVDEILSKGSELWLDRIHPEDRAYVQEAFRSHFDQKIEFNVEYRIQRKDGRWIWLHDRANLVEEKSGDYFAYGVFLDITTRKRAEEALRKSEEKITRYRKMKSLGLLAGGVAHDLNNILSGIVSYPELLLLELPENSRLRKPIETIQQSGHRAAAIVEDLLTVARGVATTKGPLNLNALIGDYLNSPEFHKLKKFHPGVAFKTKLDGDLLNVHGSHVHIRKAVMNLTSNASEAIEDSGTVTISTMNRYVDKPLRGYDDVEVGEYAVLSVSDDGAGISPGDLDRIFEPFYTKKVMGRSGTGLGLAVAWNVVQDHKGYIGVTTGEKGTTFELFFPITREKISEKDLAITIENFKGEDQTILVVDDVESQRDISCKMLDTLGYKSTAVSSGEQAIEYLKEKPVDLILLDMIMDPGINGLETYERVIKIHPGQKAIVISGFAETEDVKKIRKLGAGKYIKKPLMLEKLGPIIKEELGK